MSNKGNIQRLKYLSIVLFVVIMVTGGADSDDKVELLNLDGSQLCSLADLPGSGSKFHVQQ